jgi:fatty-acid peroxygenase
VDGVWGRMRIDLAAQLLRHGYDALPILRQRAGETDALATTLLGRPALVVWGEEGARLFYDQDVVRRRDAVPPPLADLLFGHGAVHGLDGDEHVARKHLFLVPLGRDEVAALSQRVDAALVEAAEGWPARVPVSVFEELVRIYGTSVLAWAGVEVGHDVAAALSRQMSQVVDGFGFSPRAYARGWASRVRLDRWAAGVIADTRRGRREAAPGTVLHQLALGEGAGLSEQVAGVELLNVLRPTVAVAWLGTYAVQALTEHPEEAVALALPDAHHERWAFAQEVRRLCPFVPALAARVHRRTEWQGHVLEPGSFVVLDVPATNNDPARWARPEEFRPSRFLERPPSAYDLVPQGGGEVATGHRCPGEGVTLSLLDRTLFRFSRMGYSVITGPVDLHRMPTLPPHGLRLSECRPCHDAHLARPPGSAGR